MTVTIEEVRAALYRYARAVDERDETALADVFGADVVLHRADGAHRGRDAVLDFYRTVFAGPTTWSRHVVTNVTAEPDGGATRARAYFQAVSRSASGGLTVVGEYADLLARERDGVVRIREKSIDVQQSFLMEVNGE
ncbi:nuclear transport factor 2 family protein [Prauserella cavernicola]|uniref:Nuclear transport factor 2 family protein n=1 Tax=Prauserella cavernicola TaxID=2800127 RepID=A0A934V753_9PSEU|nr:nuclear transport factor 2 family protein [Prauserella cavernicola]MBK1787344.1 nuclear transport factor 2 family protein [Prauserella cavernicola]